MIVVSSGAGLVAQPFCVWYSASKAAVEKLGEGLRMEARQFGVDVATLMPGWTKTPILASAPKVAAPIAAYAAARSKVERRSAEFLDNSQSPEAVARAVLRMLSARRMRSVERVGKDVRSSFWARRLTPAPLYERMVRRYYGVDEVAGAGAAAPSAIEAAARQVRHGSRRGLAALPRRHGGAVQGPRDGQRQGALRLQHLLQGLPPGGDPGLLAGVEREARGACPVLCGSDQGGGAEGETFVEVGVGDGSLTRFALRAEKVKSTPALLFVDLSPDMLTKAAKRFRKTSDTMFLVNDVNTLAIPKRSVRRLGCYGALHVFPEPQRALSHMAELLQTTASCRCRYSSAPECLGRTSSSTSSRRPT